MGDCTRVDLFNCSSLIADNAGPDSTQPETDAEQEKQLESSENNVKPTATDDNGSNWKSTAYSTTKLAINLVKESADVFPPLKSVVGGLSAILNHCDVRSIPYHPTHNAHGCPSKRWRAARRWNRWCLELKDYYSR